VRVRVWLLQFHQIGAGRFDESIAVEKPNPRPGLLAGESLKRHRLNQQFSDPDSCLSGTEE